MLKTTTTGAPKIIDLQDFSGEGRVEMAPATREGDSVKSADGNTYRLAGETPALQFGYFHGASLKYSEAVASVDKFADLGVVAYKNAGGTWVTKIDTNNDKDFGDEAELWDFSLSRRFVKIGEKRSLTVSAAVAAEGKLVILTFDDGSHGTHVAGIAAGYEPNGLAGVAPGAQVIGAKIGDNRLAGGSTTTASMLLAIDYAVSKGAHIINLSYGIRAGSNLGKSTIDNYVDKIAREKGTLFSISAGNEGPGLLTIGVPAGADLAITNGAYVSKRTAHLNYGYIGVEEDNTWFFSSVGPRLDGGLKPTLLAPGSALSSTPLWSGGHGNFRGTSMASPQTTGGLALLVSAAKQANVRFDRASVTRAVYDSATPVPNLSLIEQGHGLFSVPNAFEKLRSYKTIPAEYVVSVNTPSSPSGKGAGIFVRASQLPSNVFNVAVTPTKPAENAGAAPRLLRLIASSPLINLADTTLWIKDATRTFQVALDPTVQDVPGLHSHKITAIDDETGAVAFTVPVTVISPVRMDESNGRTFTKSAPIKVGQTLRYFIEVPSGATAAQVDLSTDGPAVWGQLLDPEGRKVLELRDAETTSPLPPILKNVNLERPGVYELDIVAPATNRKTATVTARLQLFSLSVEVGAVVEGSKVELRVQNNYDAIKVVPTTAIDTAHSKKIVEIGGNSTRVPIEIDDQTAKLYEEIVLRVVTSAKYYDQMTDYPYRVFDKEEKLILAGGLELNSSIEIGDLETLAPSPLALELQGAFTEAAPKKWFVELIETRRLKTPAKETTGPRTLIEPGQTVEFLADTDAGATTSHSRLQPCGSFVLNTPAMRPIQSVSLCE